MGRGSKVLLCWLGGESNDKIRFIDRAAGGHSPGVGFHSSVDAPSSGDSHFGRCIRG